MRLLKWSLPFIFAVPFLGPQIRTQAQELTQDSVRLKMESKIKKDYHLDSLGVHFAIFPRDTSLHVWGEYYPARDSLNLNYYSIMDFCKETSMNPDSILAVTMQHELGHNHTDRIRERLGLKSILEDTLFSKTLGTYVYLLKLNEDKKEEHVTEFENFVNEFPVKLTDILLERMVEEGIGRYYENPSKIPYVGFWPISIKNIKNSSEYNRYLYTVGWGLMYPIISSYGDRGIEYVLKNMPKYGDFSDLKSYRNRVLEKLEEETWQETRKNIKSIKFALSH
jgi:hypothetical protein